MCFSASASFTASAALGIIGTGTIIKAKRSRELALALVPIFFAIQQFVEGALWLSFASSGPWALIFTYIFLFFALFWWPAYVPWACYNLETVKSRKRIIGYLVWLGLTVGLVQYGFFLAKPTVASIVNQSIFYKVFFQGLTWYNLLVIIAYGLSTVGAALLSSKRFINIFGVLTAVAALIAWRIYTINFAWSGVFLRPF